MSRKKTKNLQNSQNFSDFSKRLAEVLDKRPQTYIAKKLNVSQHTISAWLRGEIPKQITSLYLLAKELDVDLHWLITGEHLGIDKKDPRVREYVKKLEMMARLNMRL